jgi:hypothetical protein
VQISPTVQQTLYKLSPGIGTHSVMVSSHWEECSDFAADAIHIVSVFVPLGTHYCWVARGNVDSNLDQVFYT